MSLNDLQLQTLRQALLAETDPTFVGYRNSGSTGDMTIWINQEAAPKYYVWKTSVTPTEWRDAILGGSGALQLDALTVSKRDALLWAVSDSLNPSNALVRAALDDFCGSQNSLKSAVQAAQKRGAKRGEKIFASGAGTLAAPSILVFEGSISEYELVTALNLI